MLIRFKVANFLSFDTEQSFSMICGSSEIHPSHIAKFDHFGLLRATAIYGANASGKSNFIKAISSMRQFVVFNDPIVSDRYFRPNPENRDKPSLFEVEFESNGRLYSYGFEYMISKQEVVDEWLHEMFPDRDSKVIFERTGDSIIHPFTGQDKDRMDIYAEDMAGNPRRLFLNVMGTRTRSKDVELRVFSEVRDWFEKKLLILDTTVPFLPDHRLDDEFFKRLNRLMASFGTGINEMGYERKKGMEEVLPQEISDRMKKMLSSESSASSVRLPRSYLSFSDYRVSLADDGSLIFDEVVFRHNNSRVTFHAEDESDGTKKLYNILANLFTDEKDITFLMDDLDSRLHPGLTYRLVKMFLGSDETREKQLIFTTHESSLMDFGLLRRDEIWFSEKDTEGASRLYSLEDFNERCDRRIEKAYREGRYGGIPVFSSVFPYEDER